MSTRPNAFYLISNGLTALCVAGFVQSAGAQGPQVPLPQAPTQVPGSMLGPVRGASPYVAIENEPPPKLVVDPTPLAAGLAHGIVWVQYRVENVHIVPVFGAGALNVSPRIGHLHIHLDDLPWGWVEATSDNNTISVAGLPPGQHKMLVELVDANHHLFPGCAECRQTVTFTVPETTSHH